MSHESILAPFQNQLVLALGSARAFHLVPGIHYREVWNRLGDVGTTVMAQAEEMMACPIPALTLSDFLDQPEKWQENRMQRRRRLHTLALAAAMEGGSRYIRPLAEIIWSICEESSWISPETARLDADPLPDCQRPQLDLTAAQTALDLSVVCQMAGNELSSFSQRLIDRVYRCVEERVITPFLEQDLPQSNALESLPGCMVAFLTFVGDDKRRWSCMRRAWRLLDEALRMLREDGSVEGGLAEWLDCAEPIGDCMELIRIATEGEIDLARLDIPCRLFRNAARRFLTGRFFLNPGERDPMPRLDGVRVYRLGDFADDDMVRDLGVHLVKTYGTEGEDRDLWHVSYRVTRAMDIQAEKVTAPRLLQCYLPDSQMLVARSRAGSDAGFLLAAWGGHNGEKNAHLDVGNLLVFSNGEPVLCDIGSFADTDLHSLPVVGGFTQQFGRQYRAQDAACRLTEDYALLTLDLSTAYPSGAAVYGWQRTAILIREENSIQLIDAFDLSRRQTVRFCFISPFEPVITARHVQLGSARLRWEPDLIPGVEEIPLQDEALREIWGEKLYRLYFDTPSEVDGGKYTFTFNLLRTYGSLG